MRTLSSNGSSAVQALLAVPAFRNYLCGQTLSGFGDSLMPVALVFAVLAQGAGAGAVGLVLLASRAPAILLALLGGAVGDRADRRTVLLVADIARFLLQASTAALLITSHAPVWALASLQAGAGAASALFIPAAAGLTATSAPPGLLIQANALLNLTRNTVALAGLALSGALVGTVGPGPAFALDALTFGASAGFLARLPRQPARPCTGMPLWRAGLLGVSEVLRSRWLLTSITYAAALNVLGVCPFLVLGPVIAQQQLGGAPAWTAVTLAYATGSIAGSSVTLRWHPRHPLRTAFSGVFALSPFLYLLGTAAPLPAIVTAAAAAGTQASIFNTLHISTLQAHVPDHLVARVISVNTLGALAALPLGLALIGPIAQATSPRAVLTGAGLLTALATAIVLLVKQVRDLEQVGHRHHDPAPADSAAP